MQELNKMHWPHEFCKITDGSFQRKKTQENLNKKIRFFGNLSLQSFAQSVIHPFANRINLFFLCIFISPHFLFSSTYSWHKYALRSRILNKTPLISAFKIEQLTYIYGDINVKIIFFIKISLRLIYLLLDPKRRALLDKQIYCNAHFMHLKESS